MNSESNYFDRQMRIPFFSQDKVSSSTLAILGVGGIGTNLALLAARFGFKKLILVDNDLIEPSNLNRQTLFSKRDVGKKKVEVARNNLDNRDNLISEIITHDHDLFEDWQKTVEIVRESDYVLNGLDLPEIKRTLIGILCLKIGKPMIYSGTDPTSGYSGMILYQASTNDKPCHECLQAILPTIKDKSLVNKYNLDNILKFQRINWLELEPEDFKSMKGATTVITAMFASVLTMNILIQIIHGYDVASRIIFDLFLNDIENYRLEKREGCLACGDKSQFSIT